MTEALERSWLVKHPGTSPFLARVKEELAAMLRWHGPAFMWLTCSANTSTEDALGTWLSHLAGREGRKLQVWHVADEVARLTPLQSQDSQDDGSSKFFVHQQGEEEEEGEEEQEGGEGRSCPYHPSCTRTPLEAWTARFTAKLLYIY